LGLLLKRKCLLHNADEGGFCFSNEEKCLHKADEDRFGFSNEEKMSS